MKKSKRVVVTGLGIITSIGELPGNFSDSLFQGACGIGPISLFDVSGFPCKTGAQIKNGDLYERFNPREIKRISRCDLLGVIASNDAVADAGLDFQLYDRTLAGVVLGAGAGGMLSLEKYRREKLSGKKVPSRLLSTPTCTLTDLIASRYRLSGFRSTISTACSSSATSIGYGSDLIRSGAMDIVVTGGGESLSELTFAGFNSLRVMDRKFCKPFDKNRKGLSLGEGAGILILEEYEHARQRGVKIYAELLGYAVNSDAYHMTSPDPEGNGMARVMTAAIKNAGVKKDTINYINAHGTGTIANDSVETKAIKSVFEKKLFKNIRISSTKSMLGHCLGAAGAIEAVVTVLAIKKQIAPPTIHLKEPDSDCDLDYVPNFSSSMEIRVAMSNSFAFGGNNTSIVFGKYVN